MSREALLIIIAAMIAGAIGFGIAVYAVPLEEIVQFRALVNAGLGAISMTNHADNSNTGVEHPTVQPPKTSIELDSPARGRTDANPSCDPHNANCVGGSPTGAATPTDTPNLDGATQNSPPIGRGGTPQAPALKSEPPRFPSLSTNAGSEKAHVAPGGHSKRPAKKAKLKGEPSNNP
jgi:hypothetical protein